MGFSITREQIAEVFKKELVATPVNKRVTVTQLAKACSMERKRFYSYFDTIDDVIHWIFRSHVAQLINNEFSQYEKFYHSGDKYAELPIYVRIPGQCNHLNQKEFYKKLGNHWEENRTYYECLFRSSCYINFFTYLLDLYLPCLKRDIVYMLGDRELPEIIINFLAEYHLMGIWGRVHFHFTETKSYFLQSELDCVWNYAHDTLAHSLDMLTNTCSNDCSERETFIERIIQLFHMQR